MRTCCRGRIRQKRCAWTWDSIDARHGALADRAAAPAGGAIESWLQRRHVIHGLRDAAPLPPGVSAESPSNGCVNWPPARPWPPPDARVTSHRESSTTCCSGPSALANIEQDSGVVIAAHL
jgi:hypothetical protein